MWKDEPNKLISVEIFIRPDALAALLDADTDSKKVFVIDNGQNIAQVQGIGEISGPFQE